MDYTRETVTELIRHRDYIESFLERTTGEIFPTYYDAGDDGYYDQEGNTLNNNGSHNTRVPKRDSLRENLMVMLADIDCAMMALTLEQRLAVLYYLTIYQGRKGGKSEVNAMEAVEQMVQYLNG